MPKMLLSFLFLVVVLSSLVLQSCAVTNGKDDPLPGNGNTPPEGIFDEGSFAERIDPDIVYYIGAAEIAGRQQLNQIAAKYYLKAALLSDDPAIAQRAVQIAVFANLQSETQQASARWLELAPSDPEAHRMAAIVTLKDADLEASWQSIEAMLRLQAVRSDLDGADVWGGIVKLLAASPSKSDARELLTRLTELYLPPASIEVLMGLSDLAVSLNEIEQAEHYATLSLKLEPDNAANLNWRGRLRTSLGLYDEAREDFARAVELEPDNVEMRQTYAVLLAELDDYVGALEQLESLEDNVSILYSKSLYAVASDQPDRAEDAYQRMQALEVDEEGQDDKYFFLGQLAEALDKPIEEAIDWLKQVRSGERLDTARLRMAILMGQKGDMSQARFVLQRLQNGSAEVAARAFRAEAGLLEADDQIDQAMEVMSQAVGMLAGNVDVLYARAMLADRMDRFDITEKDLRQVLVLEPDESNALNALGYSMADRSVNLDEALDMIERAHAQQPESAAVIDSLGWVHYRLGNLDKAIEYMRKAHDMQDDPEIIAHLGEVLWVSGQQDEALKVWAEGLAAVPDSEIIQATRARLSE